MRNNSTKQKDKKKKFNVTSLIKVSSITVCVKLPKKLESLEEKKAVHTSCKHGVRRICQLYTKGGPAGKLT